jgi:hypothetical protein
MTRVLSLFGGWPGAWATRTTDPLPASAHRSPHTDADATEPVGAPH